MAKKKTENIQEALLNDIIEESDRSQTFNPLMKALRENDKKNLFSTNVTTAFMKTGFHLFDFYFGSVINIHNELGEIVEQQPRVGQAAGTFNLIIGATGSAKSTLAIQLASNIIRPYPNSSIIHFDAEQRIDISRIENISKLPVKDFEEGGRYILKSGLLGMDTIQEMVVKIYASKVHNKDLLMIDTGHVDEFNKPLKIYQPTVIIIDSITSVIRETFSPDNAKELNDAMQLQGNTEGARSAMSIKGFFRDVLPLCKEVNIIIYAINHINVNMSMNSFVPVAKQQINLKQDESIPGGRVLLYYPFNIIKLTAKPSDNFTEESDGFAGHMVMVEPIKTSSNQSGNNSKGISFDMVFSYKNGFDSLRSLIVYGRERGIIEGNKNRMKFKNRDYHFSIKSIHDDVNKFPIWEDIKEFIIPQLKTHLSFVEHQKFDPRSLDY